MPEPLAARLRERIRSGGPLPFVEFCRAALYDPADGYYRRQRHRVGARRGTDFVTNLAARSVFAPLVVEAVRSLAAGADLSTYRFVEVGAEPGEALLDGHDHPFGGVSVVRIGEELSEPRGPTVLFANEWLDARPFVRLRFSGDRWEESFAALDGTGEGFREVFGEPESDDARGLLPGLPSRAPEGYRLDLSIEAERCLDGFLAGKWPGVFLAFDYGSSWEALSRHLPEGTGRAQAAHRQSADLFADPGERDLTCNVCWDRIAAVLADRGFVVGGPERQEAFFLRKAADTVRWIVEGGQDEEARERRARLTQILSPAHFGAAFQALWGIRRT